MIWWVWQVKKPDWQKGFSTLLSQGYVGIIMLKCVKELKQLVNDRVNEDLIRQRSRFLKALSDSTRLKIIELLNVREMCVCEIMAALDLTQPTASHHLNLLENAGLLNDRREGKWVFYSLANPEIPKILEKIHSTKKPTLREH